jgi:hypothetical protein
MSIERDLERWEAGAMSADELASAYPSEDVADLMALHERMSTIAADPVRLDEAALQRLLARLPDRARPRRRYRSVLLAAAAVLLMGSMAVAVPGVQHGVTAVTHGVGRLLGITEPPPAHPAPSVPSTTSPGRDATPDHRGGSDGAADPTDHSSGGHGADGTDGDEHGGATATEGGGDQGQDQQGDGGSAGQSDEGSGSSQSSGGSGSGTDEQGDGSGGDSQNGSAGDDADGQS